MWAFYVIWVVSLIAVAFAVERLLGLRRSRIIPADLAAGLRASASRKGEFDIRYAQRLCRDYPSSAAYVVKAMLAKVGRPLPEIEHAMTEALEHEATRQYANVRVQNLAFNVARCLAWPARFTASSFASIRRPICRWVRTRWTAWPRASMPR